MNIYEYFMKRTDNSVTVKSLMMHLANVEMDVALIAYRGMILTIFYSAECPRSLEIGLSRVRVRARCNNLTALARVRERSWPVRPLSRRWMEQRVIGSCDSPNPRNWVAR